MIISTPLIRKSNKGDISSILIQLWNRIINAVNRITEYTKLETGVDLALIMNFETIHVNTAKMSIATFMVSKPAFFGS